MIYFLRVGDVIEEVNGDSLDKVPFKASMERLASVKAGHTFAFSVRRSRAAVVDVKTGSFCYCSCHFFPFCPHPFQLLICP
jgi:hypothetical protein